MADKGKKTAVKWWIKLPEHFFGQIQMEKMYLVNDAEKRKAIQLIYIKLLLLTVRYDGILPFQHEFPTLAEEIAFTIKENVDDVSMTLEYLLSNALIQQLDDDLYYLTEIPSLTETESEGAERKRKQRAREKAQKMLMSEKDENVTSHDLSQNVTECHDKEKESQINTQRQRENESKRVEQLFASNGKDFCHFWETITEKYPNKNNFSEAKAILLGMLEGESFDEMYHKCSCIGIGINLFLADYRSRNQDDEEGKYIKQLSKWLSNDSDYWIRRAEEYQKTEK